MTTVARRDATIAAAVLTALNECGIGARMTRGHHLALDPLWTSALVSARESVAALPHDRRVALAVEIALRWPDLTDVPARQLDATGLWVDAGRPTPQRSLLTLAPLVPVAAAVALLLAAALGPLGALAGAALFVPVAWYWTRAYLWAYATPDARGRIRRLTLRDYVTPSRVRCCSQAVRAAIAGTRRRAVISAVAAGTLALAASPALRSAVTLVAVLGLSVYVAAYAVESRRHLC